MADNMIEHVAKALYKAGWAHTDADDEVIQDEWDSSVKHRVQHKFKARAAIKAMREPSQKMVDAARWNGFEGEDRHVQSDWQAMIDAALNEDGNE